LARKRGLDERHKVTAVLALTALLAGCGGQAVGDDPAATRAQEAETATTTVPAENLSLLCPASEQGRTDLDIPGPGRATPEQAVAPFAGGGGVTTVAEEQRDRAVVHVLGTDGNVVRTFQVSEHDDGWWPDGYFECSG
jgi:hypothetical protein